MQILGDWAAIWAVQLGAKLGEGCQREEPLPEAGVRNRQGRLVHYGVAVEQDVDVDLARAPALTLLPAQKLLDLLDAIQQCGRSEAGDRLDDGIDEGWLVG